MILTHPGGGSRERGEGVDLRELPHNANLRHLRRQARELQRASGEPLQAAQHRLATAYGFSSWSELKKTLVAATTVDEWGRRLLGKTALEALRDAGAAPEAGEIVPALKHPNPRIRHACLGLLDHLAGEESIAAMVAATADPVPRVRRMAVHALGCQSCKAAALCANLNAVFIPIAEGDPAWKVRREAVISIVQQPADAVSRGALSRIADRDAHPEVRKQAAWAARIQLGLGWSWSGRRSRPRDGSESP